MQLVVYLQQTFKQSDEFQKVNKDIPARNEALRKAIRHIIILII